MPTKYILDAIFRSASLTLLKLINQIEALDEFGSHYLCSGEVSLLDKVVVRGAMLLKQKCMSHELVTISLFIPHYVSNAWCQSVNYLGPHVSTAVL